MRCAVCQFDNSPNTAFCLSCGTMLAPSANTPATPKSSGGVGVIVTAVVAVLSTLGLGSVIVFTALDDDPPATTTTTEATTTTVPASQWDDASAAWREFSASFLQPQSTPFRSEGEIFAIATVDDLAARPSATGAIAGLVLLEWRDDQWAPFSAIPWTNPTDEVTIEVLGDELVDHPMVLISTCCPENSPSTWAFRVIDGELLDVITGNPIESGWNEVLLTDRSFDFLEYVACDAGEEITTASGGTAFFCDLEIRSRLEILDDSSTRLIEEEVTNERPPQIYPNDLDVRGTLMTQPECDGSYITAVGASVSSREARNRANITRLLAKYPGASYLRTDQTCDSLWPAADGAPIYVVYFGPFATKDEACDARSSGPRDAYVRPLSDTISHHTKIYC